MLKKSLYWGLMATSLYLVWGCSESGQAVGATTAQEQAEEAVAAAAEADPLAGADALADDSAVDENLGYEDQGAANPIKQILEGEPVEVSFNMNEFNTKVYGKLAYNVVIQSKVDDVTINDIIINRGNNCGIGEYDHNNKLPANLKFGQVLELAINCDANFAKEIEVKTDYGNYQFNTTRR